MEGVRDNPSHLPPLEKGLEGDLNRVDIQSLKVLNPTSLKCQIPSSRPFTKGGRGGIIDFHDSR